jgi:K+-sensing histidine kinase KdpD
MNVSENSLHESSELSRPFALRYGCAVVSIALVTWIRLLFDPVLSDHVLFPPFLFAVLLAGLYGGALPATFVVLLCAISVDYFLILPISTNTIP